MFHDQEDGDLSVNITGTVDAATGAVTYKNAAGEDLAAGDVLTALTTINGEIANKDINTMIKNQSIVDGITDEDVKTKATEVIRAAKEFLKNVA